MSKKGFTLIEVMIATTVMVSVLVALVYSLTQAADVTTTAHNQDIALSAIQDKLEEISNDLANIAGYDGQTFAVKADTGTGPAPLLTTPPGMADPGEVKVVRIPNTELYNVTVRVSWQQKIARPPISREVSTVMIVR